MESDVDDFLQVDIEDCDNDPFLIEDDGQSYQPVDGKFIPQLPTEHYSLNSPLSKDELDFMIDGLKSHQFPVKGNLISSVRSGYQALIGNITRPEDLPNSQEIHKRIYRMMNNWTSTGPAPDVLISKLNKFKNISMRVCNKYWGNLTDKCYPYDFFSAAVGDQESLDYLRKGISFHVATLLINSKGPSNTRTIAETFGITGIVKIGPEQKGRHPMLSEDQLEKSVPTFYEVENFFELGLVRFFRGWMYLANYDLLLPRNLVLMIKDIQWMRHTSIMYLKVKFPGQEKTLKEVYRIIDGIFGERGSVAYKGVKLVEPICLDKLSNIADSGLPKILNDDKLSIHVKNKLDELLEKDNLDFYGFKNCVDKIQDPQCCFNIFGSFRQWGHPFIEYEDGLQKLHERTHEPKEVDEEYSKMKAGFFKREVLCDQFKKTKTWFVDKNQLNSKDRILFRDGLRLPPRADLKSLVWWADLPVKKCFEVPDILPASDLYDDKGFSINRQELYDHLQRSPNSPIPSRRVLLQVLESKDFNVKDFLEHVSKNGISKDDLIIGLLEKERELKSTGRFFAICGFTLRMYFVVTEYLIKKFYGKLFKGMTSTNSMAEINELLEEISKIQSGDFEKFLNFVNHFDFEGWCSHQTLESTFLLFSAMDDFLGLKDVISRTHILIKASLVYYRKRPDLINVEHTESGPVLTSKSSFPVVWEGSMLGGIEGQRQAGWTIDGIITMIINSKNSSAKINILANGDNQNLICRFNLNRAFKSREDLEEMYQDFVRINNDILEGLNEGIKKSGLKLNKDETLTSTRLLIYNKILLVKGIPMSSAVKGTHRQFYIYRIFCWS